MRILIVTGIYPPDIGGPAQYVKNIEKAWKDEGHAVKVLTFRFERRLPNGIRHLWYILRLFPRMITSDMVIAMDTFSAGVPAVIVAKVLRKKIIVRTGGDFLWESYVERTGDLVLLRDFYNTRANKLSRKERLIFRFTRFMLAKADGIVFSTKWQRGIFAPTYGIDLKKTYIIENYYGEKEKSFEPNGKDFLASARDLKWKNIDRLKDAFAMAQAEADGISLEIKNFKFEDFMDKMSRCYAVVLVSLGDISPNMILDAIRYSKPFILTRETGLYDRLKDIGLFADPENISDIKEKIIFLANDKNYQMMKEKVKAFSFTHSWQEICKELMDVYKNLP